MNVTHSYIWFPQDEVDPDDAPPEDEDEGILSFSSINNRQSPSQNLYLPFGINYGLSYSCSSSEYNIYTVSASKNSTGTLNGSSVLLHAIQVYISLMVYILLISLLRFNLIMFHQMYSHHLTIVQDT